MENQNGHDEKLTTPTSPPIQGTGNSNKLVQPSPAFVKEMKASISEPAAAAPPHLPPQNPHPQPPQPNSVYPDVESHNTLSLNGSLPEEQPQNLPIGLYIIVGFLFLGFILGFFNNNTNLVYTLLLFVNLGLGVGILFKKEVAREALVIVSSILVVLEIVVLIGLLLVQSRAHQKANDAQAALNSISTSQVLTEAQSAQVNAYKAQINSEEAVLNKTYAIAYTEYSIIIVADAALIIYLTRPKIKSYFS